MYSQTTINLVKHENIIIVMFQFSLINLGLLKNKAKLIHVIRVLHLLCGKKENNLLLCSQILGNFFIYEF